MMGPRVPPPRRIMSPRPPPKSSAVTRGGRRGGGGASSECASASASCASSSAGGGPCGTGVSAASCADCASAVTLAPTPLQRGGSLARDGVQLRGVHRVERGGGVRRRRRGGAARPRRRRGRRCRRRRRRCRPLEHVAEAATHSSSCARRRSSARVSRAACVLAPYCTRAIGRATGRISPSPPPKSSALARTARGGRGAALGAEGAVAKDPAAVERARADNLLRNAWQRRCQVADEGGRICRRQRARAPRKVLLRGTSPGKLAPGHHHEVVQRRRLRARGLSTAQPPNVHVRTASNAPTPRPPRQTCRPRAFWTARGPHILALTAVRPQVARRGAARATAHKFFLPARAQAHARPPRHLRGHAARTSPRTTARGSTTSRGCGACRTSSTRSCTTSASTAPTRSSA